MAGGLLDLANNSSEDVYLTNQPQITFFKVAFRRHTNFAMETIDTAFNNEMTFGSSGTVTFKDQGDLINKMYLKIVLNSVNPEGNNFAWIRRLGHAIIDNITIDIGGKIVDRLTGTWLDIWYELSHKKDHERGYDNIIGDIPKLTTYDTNIKPSHTLLIPLQFWFNRFMGLALPLVALQYSSININVTLANLNSLIIKDDNFNNNLVTISDVSLLSNIVYLDTEERRRFAQSSHEYLIEQLQFNGEEFVTNNLNQYKLGFFFPCKELVWAVKDGNYTTGEKFLYYTHLDQWDISVFNEAAKKLLKESISINFDPSVITGQTWVLIEPTNIFNFNNVNITNNSLSNIWFNENSLIFQGQENNVNYNSLISANIEINASQEIIYKTIDASNITISDLSRPISSLVDTRYQANDPIVYQFNNYGTRIDGTGDSLESALLKYNGINRFDRRDGRFFNILQPYYYHTNIPKKGIYTYSFSIYPEEYQPSGVSNLSVIESIFILFNFNQEIVKPTSRCFIFGRNTNILRFFNGLAGTAYNFT